MIGYKKYIQKVMSGAENFDPTGKTYKISFLTNAYTPDLTDSGHEFYTDLAGVAEEITLTGVTLAVATRIFGATGPTSIPDDNLDTITQAVLWRDTGVAATSPLIGWDDTVDYTQDGVAENLTIGNLIRIGGA